MSETQIPVLQEHQAPEPTTSTSPSGYEPSIEEKRNVALVNKLLDEAKKHRQKYDHKWLDYYKMFRGRQWKEQRPSYRHSEVINMVFQSIQSTVPILTDSRPKLSFVPTEPSDYQLSEILNKVSESDWEQGNWLQILTEIIYDAHFYGAGFGSMEFDPKADLGVGRVVFDSFDPFYCYPDPNARNVNVKSRHFITAEPVEVSILKQDYPDKRQWIKPDVIDLPMGDKSDLDQVMYKSPVDKNTIIEGTSAYDLGYQDKALKVTCYMLSDEMIEEKKESVDPVTGQPVTTYVQKKKYPNGRKICIASGMQLDDGPIPYDDGKFPYSKLLNYMLPREFWGISEVEQLESPQKIFNKLVSFALDVLTLMGNPVWIVDDDSGVDTDNLFNRPGLIIEKNKGSEVRREEGVQLQPYVLQLIDRMREWFDGVSGANDVTRGVKPDGVTAAAAINSLQDAAQTRTRLKARNMDAFLQDLGQQYISRKFQFSTAPQIYRLTNNDAANQYFKFHVETLKDKSGNDLLAEDGSPKRVAKVRMYQRDPATGNYAEDLQDKEYQIRGKFDVRVSTGSSLPFAKEEKLSMAKFLLDAGAIDPPELLQAVDYPNWEAVWARVQQRKAEQMAMEQQAAGPPPGAPPGPPPPGPPPPAAA